MKLTYILSLTISLLAWPALVNATTWAPETVDDPIIEGARCDVMTVGSYGSYIYHWPSKYDQVFWPFISEASLWYCEDSGFIAFIGDFNNLSPEEISRVRTYLERVPEILGSTPTLKEKLQRLEAVYDLRDKDERFHISLLRTLAYYQENSFEDLTAAARYRVLALERILVELARSDLPENQRLEYLFVASAYTRWMGRLADSDTWLEELEMSLLPHIEEESELGGFATYLSEMKDDVRRITEGGHLAPSTP